MSSLPQGESPLLALSNNLATAVEQAGQSVVAVNARSRRSSSGVHWRPGIIITSAETIRRAEEITVTLSTGRTVPATLEGRDASTDVAVLKLHDTELPVAEIGNPSELKVGHLVLAVGRGGESELRASMGVVSTVGGPWQSMAGGLIDQLIRLDLTLYPECAGGPLVAATGQVLGINTSGPRNRALTIPASTVNRVLEQLLAKGHIARGYLGLGMQPVRLNETLQSSLSLTNTGGVIVVNVEPNGPADQVGVLIGDVLIALNGAPVSDTGDIQALLGPESVGQSLRVQLIRGGALTEVAIAPVEKPRRED